MMKKNLNRDVRKAIETSLGNVLNEAYVVEAKKYDLRTDLLSDATKQSQQKELDEFVAALNKVSAELDGADREDANNKASNFRSLKEDEVHCMNAAFLRALYFENISDLSSKITMDSLAFLRLERDFGTFDEWQRDFIACCMSSRDGYAITGYSVFLKRYMNFVIDEEAKNVGIAVLPVIVLDVNLGAYFRDYLDNRKTYVMGMMKEFDWERIEERFKRAEKVAKIPTSGEGR
jgi:Fe-Mn family superoxide dismutase